MALPGSTWLHLAPSGSPWLPSAPLGSHRLPTAPPGSPELIGASNERIGRRVGYLCSDELIHRSKAFSDEFIGAPMSPSEGLASDELIGGSNELIGAVSSWEVTYTYYYV